MSLTIPRPSLLSASFRRRADDLEAARNALLHFGRKLDLFRFVVSGETHARFPDVQSIIDTATVEELLGILVSEWDPETHPHQAVADPRGEAARTLRISLLALGEEFDIFVVRDAATSRNDHAILRFMEEEWHATSGCHNHVPSPNEVQLVERKIQRNLQMLQTFAQQVQRIPPLALRGVARRYAESSTTGWYREAKYLAHHAVLTWMPDIDESPITEHALALAMQIPEDHGWSVGDATHLVLALNDAIVSNLTFQVVRPHITEALYEPMAAALPLEQYEMDLSRF